MYIVCVIDWLIDWLIDWFWLAEDEVGAATTDAAHTSTEQRNVTFYFMLVDDKFIQCHDQLF